VAEVEYVLVVGLYPQAEPAVMDLRDLTNPGPVAEVLAGTGLVARVGRGVTVQQGGGGTLGYGIGTGAAAGLVVGHWMPWPLTTAVVGAVIGGLIGVRLRRRESAHLLALIDLDLRVGETALVTVVPAVHLGEVRHAMWRARKTTGRVLDDPDSLRLARGLVRGNPVATEALGGIG
jgi:hypothetical protein